MIKYFIDSSVIIENYKKNPQAQAILKKYNSEYFICINAIVISEVAYILKKKLNYNIKQIKKELNYFEILPIEKKTVLLAYNYMDKYKMKPNDALIAASCKYHKIPNLLSIDSDFNAVCSNENINLISK